MAFAHAQCGVAFRICYNIFCILPELHFLAPVLQMLKRLWNTPQFWTACFTSTHFLNIFKSTNRVGLGDCIATKFPLPALGLPANAGSNVGPVNYGLRNKI
jgi:hypothetical protein